MALLSQKSMEANRRNAQHSTGPRTCEGKERSRANATTHGLSAVATIYRPLRHENPDDFIALRARLLADFNPANAAEHLAVEMAAAAYRRIQRVEAMEVAFCDGSMAEIQCRHGKEPIPTSHDDLGAALTAGQKSNKLTWEVLDRWRRHAWLDYNRSIDQIRKLQRERAEAELRDLRLHDEREKRRCKTQVATQGPEKSMTSASFRHMRIAARRMGHPRTGTAAVVPSVADRPCSVPPKEPQPLASGPECLRN